MTERGVGGKRGGLGVAEIGLGGGDAGVELFRIDADQGLALGDQSGCG
jgi:hypothetical protein